MFFSSFEKLDKSKIDDSNTQMLKKFFVSKTAIFDNLINENDYYSQSILSCLQSELKLFIPILENRTARTFDLNELTSQLREMLAGVQGVQIVRSADESQAVILAKIVEFSKGWGPTAFKGSIETESKGGLRDNFLSAQSVGITLGIEITKINPEKEKVWTIVLTEKDFYQLTDRLELSRGSAEAPQIHASREALLVKKLSERIFRRAKAQIVDDF